MGRLKKILSKLGGNNSLNERKKIQVQHEEVPETLIKYNRHERRTGAFVVYNVTSDKYMQGSTKKDGTLVFRDVDLKHASKYMYKSLDYVMSCVLLHEPNLDIEYRMVYKHKGELKCK
jgi:hypothetical protein